MNIENLYKTEAPTMRALLVRKGISEEDAEDIVHDAFVRLMSTPRPFAVRSWLFVTALNIAHDRERSTKKRKLLLEGLAPLHLPPGAVPCPRPYPHQWDITDTADLFAALASVTDRQLDALLGEGDSNRPDQARYKARKKVGEKIARSNVLL